MNGTLAFFLRLVATAARRVHVPWDSPAFPHMAADALELEADHVERHGDDCPLCQ